MDERILEDVELAVAIEILARVPLRGVEETVLVSIVEQDPVAVRVGRPSFGMMAGCDEKACSVVSRNRLGLRIAVSFSTRLVPPASFVHPDSIGMKEVTPWFSNVCGSKVAVNTSL